MFGTSSNRIMQTAKVLNDVDYTPKNKRMEPENAGFQMEYPLSGCQVWVVNFCWMCTWKPTNWQIDNVNGSSGKA